VSHLWWGLWAVMQATISTLDFDYLRYAELRLREYRKLRPGV
jgi:ethanolamine kinase